MIECKNMNEIRENIDFIDKKIIKLISERSMYVKQAAKFKKDEEAVKDGKRVKAVIEKVKKLAIENDLNPDIAEGVYRKMISSFIEYEMAHFNQK